MMTLYFFKSLDRSVAIAVGLLVAVAILVPFFNLAFAEGSALHIPTYMVQLIGKYLTYALLALALDLVWGFCGILSLGHAAFFAIGGYAMGMYLMRQIGSRGSYGNPILPDFMVFLNYKELPWFWYGFDHFWFACIMVVLAPGLLAFVFGWFAFRSRVNGVYLSIITQAMTYALLLAFFRNDMGFGGNNGLTDFKDIIGFDVAAGPTRSVIFALSALAVAGSLLLSSAIVRSKFGKVLVGVRDAESRTRFLGYRVENYKLFVWTVSAVMAGIAGALYVPQVGIINPSEFEPANSIEAVIWVAVGGRGTLIGAIIGAIGVNFGKSWFTAALPDVWLFALGALFIVVTLFLPKGIVGTVKQYFATRKEYSDAAVAESKRADDKMAASVAADAEPSNPQPAV
jgi:urea transport system permease protein